MRERRGRKVRIDLNSTELRLIKPGLDLTAKRLRAALNEQGLQPGRGYNKQFARKIRDLHRTLARNNEGATLYFDATQISVLVFALSETRRRLLTAKTERSRKKKRPLIQELEESSEKLVKVRKCAERAAIKESGKTTNGKRRQRWKTFKVWLYSAIRPKTQMPKHAQRPGALREGGIEETELATKNPERLRSQRFREITREVIARCTTLQLSEAALGDLVRRMKSALQCSPVHHGLDLDEAVNHPEKAQEFILDFIRKKTPHEASIKLEYADLSTQQSTRADKFRRATVVELDDTAKTDAPAEIRNCKQDTSEEKRSLEGTGTSEAHTSTSAIKNPTGDLQHQAVLHQPSRSPAPLPQDPAATAGRSAPSTTSPPDVHVKSISTDAFSNPARETSERSALPQESCGQAMVLPEHTNRPPLPEKTAARAALNVPQPLDSESNSEIRPPTKSPPLVTSSESDAAHEQRVTFQRVSPELITAAVAEWLEVEVKGGPDRWYEVIDSAKQIAKGLPLTFEQKPVKRKLTFQQVLADNRPAHGSDLIPGQTDYFGRWIVNGLMVVCSSRIRIQGFLESGLNQAERRRRERELRGYNNQVRYI